MQMPRLPLYIFLLLLIPLAGCSRSSSHETQGYIEGRFTYMATNVSGVLKEIMVDRGSQVKQGDPLFVLEQQPESDLYDEAVKNLESATSARDAIAANLVYAKLTFERNKVLVPKKAIQQSELDRSKSVYDSTIAQLAEAEANVASASAVLSKARWTLEQKAIRAPVDAMVFQRFYRLGEYTEAAKPIVSLLAPQDIKVIFYVREPDLGHIHVNNKVSVRCDTCTRSYEGTISFISPVAEYTPPVIFSNENNEKFIYRVEARFLPQEAHQLHPGQPVRVTYSLYD